MSLNRREFVVLTIAAAAGCKTSGPARTSADSQEGKPFDAGPLANYVSDGVYDQYRDQGFFIIRRSGHLSAVSSLCTHRACKLDVAGDQSYYCKCHGSTFDANGKVTKGPATLDLPILPTTVGSDGRVFVAVGLPR